MMRSVRYVGEAHVGPFVGQHVLMAEHDGSLYDKLTTVIGREPDEGESTKTVHWEEWHFDSPLECFNAYSRLLGFKDLKYVGMEAVLPLRGKP